MSNHRGQELAVWATGKGGAPLGWRSRHRNYTVSTQCLANSKWYRDPLHAHVLLTGFKDVYAKQVGSVLELCVQDTSDGYTVDHIDRRHFDCDQSFMMQVIQTARLMTKEKHNA